MMSQKRMLCVLALMFLTTLCLSSLWAQETFWDKLKKHRHNRAVSGPNGKKHQGSTEIHRGSRGVRNKDGSFTVDNSTSATNEKWGTVNHQGSTTTGKDDKGHWWKSKKKVRHGEKPWGWNTESSGRSRKTKDGSAWNNEKVITDQKGRLTKINSQGKWVKNPDGTWKLVVDKTKTFHDGRVVHEAEETVFRTGKDGLKWDKKTKREGGFFGPSATKESGGASLGKDGLKWQNNREHINQQGKKWFTRSRGGSKLTEKGSIWNRQTEGSSEDGKFKWKWGKKNRASRDANGNVNVNSKMNGDVGGEKGRKFKEWLQKMQKKNKNKPRKKWWKKK